jgi:SAM-dependent methyltransferase
VASRFDAVADRYEAGRPGYPDELFDAIEQLSGISLAGAHVLDAGAGTGKATRAMAERGATVVAADHGRQMLDRLREVAPGVPTLLADANALPFAAASFDLVTFAQAWHWVDPDRAPGEVVRVARREGAVALWWNIADTSGGGWFAAHHARLAAVGEAEIARGFARVWDLIPTAFDGCAVETAEILWQRIVTRDVMLDEAASKSYVAALGAADMRDFLDRERKLLPDGELRELFVTRLRVVRTPA